MAGFNMKRVAIYLRVSTSKQDTDNQRRELLAVAARTGWDVVRVYEDAGISGAKGRDQRPRLDALPRACRRIRHGCGLVGGSACSTGGLLREI
jgi:DNA invertase Pin-like site-specific DNA recombinase